MKKSKKEDTVARIKGKLEEAAPEIVDNMLETLRSSGTPAAVKVRIYVRFFGTLLQLPIGVAGVFAPGFRLPTVRAGFKLLPLLVKQRVVDIGRNLVIGHLHAIRSHAHGKRASTINVLAILDHELQYRSQLCRIVIREVQMESDTAS